MKKALSVIVLATSMMAFAGHKEGHKEENKAKREEIKSQIQEACAEDAKATGCEGKEVGEGLLKCIHAYKKDHKEFKVSDKCKQARKSGHEAHKEMKAAKEAAKAEKAAEEKK